MLLLLLVGPGLRASGETSTSAAGQDDSGLVVEAEAWWLVPRNADLDYAFTGVGTLASGGEIQTLQQDRVAVPVFYVGWRLSTSPSTRLGVRIWEYDDRSQAETGVQPQEIGPLLASPTLLASFNFFGFLTADSASASSRLRATLVDGGAEWRHNLNHGGVLRIETGVRLFQFERTTQVNYRKEDSQVKELFINARTDTRGIGPRAAVAYDHRFGRVDIGALFGLALPVGDLEAFNRQEFIVDGALDIATEATQPETTRAFLQFDGELRFTVALGRGWSARAAYAFRYWSGIERSQRFINAGTASTVPIEGDVVFEGLLLGIGYAF